MVEATQTSDQRLIKGARARAAIARHAADVASVEGLTGLSLGKLATDLGVSKSGVATLFGTKEKLQLAAVQAAREVFIDHVVAPTSAEPPGIRRLRALIDRWFDYVATPVLPGGCFRVATTVEFDSRTGPVRDAIDADRRDWFALLEKEIRRAQNEGHLAGRDAHSLAFQLDAVVAAANTGARFGDESALETARAIVDGLLRD
ncbi:TetR/AcrR family transcriptional regulator [Gordonia amicalis]|uniref:TetR/AcrR family transcriptional regulator n=1 Tax=Gordonia amicalis TaxID=89053 RepID=UPI0002A62766|nr:TetR/AcrR family transcriptional regulator [Gordonia amicalis]MBA5848465.1 TetR/AcrR family transcriptional regulator [Gordonia amicalis]MDV7101209.1 TetR/AcrR family transcriptional regulator [Gordonia amicalis]MDV7175808.1 TetR/AcrR family transcriptional regulator [Gordonia amicalis]NKX76310.1 TetR/AcrR family transcriptional regulator [Gordonia amicalis]GAC53631.1 putative TetR family transcriptional regulator [Gordonia amicalis NBRC 100051 = JCM 11271]